MFEQKLQAAKDGLAEYGRSGQVAALHLAIRSPIEVVEPLSGAPRVEPLDLTEDFDAQS